MRQNKGIWIDFSDRERFCADAKAFLRPRGGLGGGFLGSVVQGRVNFHVLGGLPRMLPGGVFERDSAQFLGWGAQEHFFELLGCVSWNRFWYLGERTPKRF